jgi:hypothetical protein
MEAGGRLIGSPNSSVELVKMTEFDGLTKAKTRLGGRGLWTLPGKVRLVADCAGLKGPGYRPMTLASMAAAVLCIA